MPDALKGALTWIGLDDASIKITGGSETDLPGVESISIKPGMWNAIVRGDNIVIAQAAGWTGECEITFTNAVLSQRAVLTLLGITAAETGTTPNIILTSEFNAKDAFKEFQFECQSTRLFSTESTLSLPKDVHIVIPKCYITDFPEITFGGWEFKPFTFKARAISDPSDADGLMFSIVSNETAVALI